MTNNMSRGIICETEMAEMASISGKVIAETDMAWLIECSEGEIWLPKSQCERTEWDGQSLDSFSVPEWLAEEKGLE